MSTHGHILIRRPPEVVFDFVADERNTYDPSIHDAELLTGEPIGAGTRFHCITTGRRPVGMTVEIVEYDRPHRLGTVTRLAGMDIASTLEFASEGDATWLHWSSDLRPHGVLRPLAPLLTLLGRRRTRAIWTGLKHTLEGQPAGAAVPDYEVSLMMRPLLACFLVLVVGLAGVAPAAAQESGDGDRLDAAVSAVVDKHHLAGLALAVVDDDGVVLAEGYGTAGDDRPVTPDTPMVIGSVTKSFTAVAVLQLVEQGLVDLDASVRTYLPWFEVADPAASEAITVRDLLAHTSGLSEFGYNRVLDPDTTLEEGVRDLRSARPTAPVGDTYQYFSPNYWTLALVIETVTAQSYGDYVAEHIFGPLQMTRSYADPAQARAAGLAQGHSTLFGFAVPREQPFRRYHQGAGYLVSTARDLSRFLLAIAHDGGYDGARILSPDSIALMKTPLVGVNESTGLGWGFANDGWEASDGADETFTAQLMWSAELGRGFVWTMNQQHILGATFARQDLNGALTALLAGNEAPASGLSMRTLGLVILGVLLVAVALTVRSLLRLRGWTRRSRGMTSVQLVRAIAPHVVVPALILFSVYRLAGPLVFGVDWAFNFRYVGAYMLPDIALLLLVAVVPDLLQAAYMAGAVAVDRFRTRGAPPEQPVDAPSEPVHA